MTMVHLWICILYSMMAWIATGDIPFAIGEDVLDGITGETLLVKTWSGNSYIKSITISRGKSIRVSAFFYGSNPVITNDIFAIIMLRYNNATRETSLILERLSMQADGIYTVEETTGTNRSGYIGIASVKWDFKLNVIDPIKVQRCNARETMDVKLKSWLRLSYLYYYGQMIAYFDGDGCYAVNHSHLHGRLLCRINNHDIRTINIENVTQRDIGLYNVVNRNNSSDYFYLNVTEEPINGIVGENVTVNWYYSRLGTNRTLQIIHTNNGKMFSLSPDNKPKIGLAFQERLIYNGDITTGYMSLILLNVGITDSGILRIETLHGITIPGCKHLVVKDVSSLTPSSVHSDVTLYAEENTISTSPTVRLTSPKELIQTTRILFNVKYVVIGVIALIIVMIGCLIWNQLMNTQGKKSVKMVAFNSSRSMHNHVPFAMRTQLQTPMVDEEDHGQLVQFTPAGNVQSVLEYSTIIDNSDSFEIQPRSLFPVPTLEEDTHGAARKLIVTSTESIQISIEQSSEKHESDTPNQLLYDYATACCSGLTLSNGVVGRSQPDQFHDDLYTKVKRSPLPTSTKYNQFTLTPLTSDECNDVNDVAKCTQMDHAVDSLQDLEVTPESTNSLNVSERGL